MVKRIIKITKENKDGVYCYIARCFHFDQYCALPEHIKDDYLDWNWNEFQKERRRISIERELATKETLHLLLKNKIEYLELVNRCWFSKARILPFRRERHFNRGNY